MRASRAWERALHKRGLLPEGVTKGPPRAPRKVALYQPPEVFPAVQVAEILLVPKPTMSQRDRWAPRPCVLRYRACCDALRAAHLALPEQFVLVSYRPMPASWSKARRAQHNGQPHQTRPDISNGQKLVEDALVAQDERLYDGRTIKLWAVSARLLIIDPRRVSVDAALLARYLPEVTE